MSYVTLLNDDMASDLDQMILFLKLWIYGKELLTQVDEIFCDMASLQSNEAI